MDKNNGVITEIQRFSVHDGPGIRTSVFFKGCPLHCAWCHNPECISSKIETLQYAEKCIGCGKCDEGCFSGAKVVCGKNYTKEKLLSIILQDKDYYKEKGGVTFTGGEPLLQKNFLKEIISLCKQNNINVALESCMILWDEEIFSSIDYLMADLKIWNDEKHKLYTKVSNEKIKENLRRFDSLGIPIHLRTPVVVGINDNKEEITAVATFAKSLKNLVKYELLPYHALGEQKYRALGLIPPDFTSPSKEVMEDLKKYAEL
jgi:pyruvate formate lyase activating enzyme